MMQKFCGNKANLLEHKVKSGSETKSSVMSPVKLMFAVKL